MIQNERDIRHEHVLDVARQMMTAARTAPKGKGVDIIEVALVTGDDVKVLSDKMVAMVEEHGMKFFLRDADNILSAEGIVLIGTHEQAQGLNCGHCGYATCAGRAEGVPCAINSVDVGIAIGSACATAAGYILQAVIGITFFITNRKGVLYLVRPKFHGKALGKACYNGLS